jgi:hypothetical protein
MNNHSIARATESPKGWTAQYWLAGDREPHTVTDEHGRPIPYRTEQLAQIAAYAALVAAMERVDAVYIPPARPKTRRQWHVVRPRTKEGRRAMFLSIFKERVEA